MNADPKLQTELQEIAKKNLVDQQVALAAFLSTQFATQGVRLTVVGGAAVQYYSKAEYVTKDLDAVLYYDTKEIVEGVMGALGFKRTSSYRHFEHPDFPFVVEFPSEPVEVGGRRISQANVLQYGAHSVRVIRVEDIIMDRIIAGVEWKQPQRLAQAKLLWLKCQSIIDKKYLRQFAKEEGYEKELKKVMK